MAELEQCENAASWLRDEDNKPISREEQRLALEHWKSLKLSREAGSAGPAAPSAGEIALHPVNMDEADAKVVAMSHEIEELRRQLAGAVIAQPSVSLKPRKEVRLKTSTHVQKDRTGKDGKPSKYLGPITEIEPGSYLGRAFRSLEKRLGSQSGSADGTEPSSSPPDSSSDGEPSDSSSSSSSGSVLQY